MIECVFAFYVFVYYVVLLCCSCVVLLRVCFLFGLWNVCQFIRLCFFCCVVVSACLLVCCLLCGSFVRLLND